MKLRLLQNLKFGEKVAEEEEDLPSYFVETSYWFEIFKGTKDVVYGAKGSGKSAIFSVLLSKKIKSKLFNDKRVLLIAAENIKDDPVFKKYGERLPVTEQGFELLWKLYFLELVGEMLVERERTYGLPSQISKEVIKDLKKHGLISVEKPSSLGDLLRRAIESVREVEIESFDLGGVELDPLSQSPSYRLPKINFRKQNRQKKTLPPISDLLKKINRALEELDLNVWIVIDHLDVAFAKSDEREGNALRALFTVYKDLNELLVSKRLVPKIFLRDDIWARITKGGYREATRVVRDTRITWTAELLFNLIIRRLLHNNSIATAYRIDPAQVLASEQKQWEFFHRIFPTHVEDGRGKHKTFEWMLDSIRDGTGRATPRELIHLLSSARDAQVKRLLIGINEPPGETLFESEALKQSLEDVSRERLNKTLYAEYPHLREHINSLERNRPRQTAKALAKKWEISEEQAIES